MADAEGWFGFWFADHYMSDTGTEALRPGGVHECWSILAGVATVTSRVRIGPLVAPTSVHHPALLANRAVTIDHLSHGRMVLGIGAGWQINEHHAYGIDLEPPGQRVSRFDEAIKITRSLLDNDHTDYHGEYYQFSDAPCDPKPIQAKLPIMVGSGSPRMLRITARHAQEWNTWGAPDLAAEKRHDFEAACEAVGTDPTTFHTSIQTVVSMADYIDTSKSFDPDVWGTRLVAGSDDRIVEELGRYGELGFQEVILPDFGLGETAEALYEGYQRFNSEIAGQFA